MAMDVIRVVDNCGLTSVSINGHELKHVVRYAIDHPPKGQGIDCTCLREFTVTVKSDDLEISKAAEVT